MKVESTIAISIEVVNQINDHCEKGIPFIIYDDKEHYMRCYPTQRRVRCYVNGECETEEQLDSVESFVIRIQTGLLVYKNFFSLSDEAPKKLTTGEVKLIEAPEEVEIEYEEDEL